MSECNSTNPEKPLDIPSNDQNKIEDLDQIQDPKTLWDRIGIHKPLAGFWNNLLYQILVLILPALIAVQLLRILYPYPESRGYRDAITGIFVLIFAIFDLGTTATISRFIADENIKNPKKMVKYIQYFIWYQAVTGLLQVTGISIWALYYANNSEIAYGIWIMLVCVIKQYPGFPGAFKGVLTALQIYDKANMIDFIQNQGIQVVTEIGFVLLGKYYGQMNPEIGELLGIAIGATFGLYLDDIIAAFIAAFFLARALTPYDITFADLFRPNFSWDIVKECTLFGIKMGLPGVLFAFTKLVSLTLCLTYIPQYTTFAALASLAGQLVAMVDRLVYQDFTAVFTEAYQNGKVKLCQYYNAHAFRFFMINSGFAIVLMLIFNSLFERIFIGVRLDYYLYTIPFVIPSLLRRALNPYKKHPSAILVAAHRPNQLLILNMAFEALKLLAWILTVAVFQVQNLGLGGVIYVLVLTEVPIEILWILAAMIYINKSVFKLKWIKYQTFAVPVMATAILYGLFSLFRATVLDRMWNWGALGAYSFWVTLVFAVIVMILLVIGFYFPLTLFLGGWDDNSVRDLRAAVKMCGPGRILVVPMTKLLFKIIPYSKLHNKFKYTEEEAFTQMQELLLLRNSNRLKVQQNSEIN